MQALTRFGLPHGFSQEQLEAILAKRFDFITETAADQSWRIYDTFDWRLFTRSLTLQWSGEELLLRTIPDGDTLRRLRLSMPPRMATGLPDGAFRTQLAGIIKGRALLELTTVHTWSRSYRILNKDEKTVVRLIYTEARLEAGDERDRRVAYLTVRPLRGYARQASRLVALLQLNPEITPTKHDSYFWALEAAELTPGANSSRLDVQLRPDMMAGKATRLILRQLQEALRANEAGIKADIDTEYLHRFRIAVRRTRSALNQIRKVFPPDKTAEFKRAFKALGRLTNDLRDLDVHLLAEADYRALLPDVMQEDVTPLFDTLRARRIEALAEVVAGLESESYLRLMAAWHDFLHEAVNEHDAENAAVPIIDVARKRLKRQYQVIVRDGNYILNHTEDELLHALRIECKQLHYLLEFFASLFPPKEVSRATKQLKRLQNNLGVFTDNKVLQEYLLSVAESLDINEPRTRQALVATGYLVETSTTKRQNAKAHFAEAFQEFASRAHQKEFQRVIAAGREAG